MTPFSLPDRKQPIGKARSRHIVVLTIVFGRVHFAMVARAAQNQMRKASLRKPRSYYALRNLGLQLTSCGLSLVLLGSTPPLKDVTSLKNSWGIIFGSLHSSHVIHCGCQEITEDLTRNDAVHGG